MIDQALHHLSEVAVSVEIETEDMTLNIGPQHPSTHGVLRLVARIDGERATEVKPVIGYMHEIDALTRQDALDWYAKWYVPNNATLVIAGDTTMAEVLPLAEKYYGAVPRGAEPTRFRPKEPPQLAERRVTFYDPRIRNPSISRNYLAPSQTKRDGVSQALTVLANLLSGSTGRFYQELVVKQNEIDRFLGHVTDWEQREYFEVF